MRYSVRTTFHVESPSPEQAGEAVESALDLLFGLHWRDLASPYGYIHNATVLHKHIQPVVAGSEADT
jgi:hypothetical protein